MKRIIHFFVRAKKRTKRRDAVGILVMYKFSLDEILPPSRGNFYALTRKAKFGGVDAHFFYFILFQFISITWKH